VAVIMKADAEILAKIDAAFSGVPRPRRFALADEDQECMDHERLLQSRTRETLRIDDVNTPGYDPLTECFPEGIAYFFPALARFALVHPEDLSSWYAEQLLSHLRYGARDNRFYHFCNPSQRSAVAALVDHIRESRVALIEENLSAGEFAQCLAWWRDAEPAGTEDAP
jgi:hypothetical protein